MLMLLANAELLLTGIRVAAFFAPCRFLVVCRGCYAKPIVLSCASPASLIQIIDLEVFVAPSRRKDGSGGVAGAAGGPQRPVRGLEMVILMRRC